MAIEKQGKIGSGFGAKSLASEVVQGIDLSGHHAVVTGGYSGLGLETVRALATAGAQICVPARRPDVAEKALAGIENVTVAKMDLADQSSVAAFADTMVDAGNGIDILVNNAAIMACPEARIGNDWESQFAVNHLGHFALTKALLPLILRQDKPRIVALSSVGHRLSGIVWDDIHFKNRTYEKWSAYGQAKTANSLMALGMQAKFGALGLDAFAVHPGGILTPLQRHLAIEEMVALGWTDENGDIAEAAKPFFKSPDGGAATSVWCATSPLLAGRGGVYCEDCDIAEVATEDTPRGMAVAEWAIDDEAALRLWNMSEEMLAGE